MPRHSTSRRPCDQDTRYSFCGFSWTGRDRPDCHRPHQWRDAGRPGAKARRPWLVGQRPFMQLAHRGGEFADDDFAIAACSSPRSGLGQTPNPADLSSLCPVSVGISSTSTLSTSCHRWTFCYRPRQMPALGLPERCATSRGWRLRQLAIFEKSTPASHTTSPCRAKEPPAGEPVPSCPNASVPMASPQGDSLARAAHEFRFLGPPPASRAVAPGRGCRLQGVCSVRGRRQGRTAAALCP